MAEFKTRLKEVSPLYQEAGKKAPDRKADLDKFAGQAAAAAKAGDLAAGMTHLAALETASKSILGAKTAPPVAPPPPPGADMAAFKARLKEVSPLYQDATKKFPDQKPALDALAAKAAGAARAGDIAGGLALLEELAAAVKAATQPKPTPEAPKAGDDDAPPVLDAAAFKKRMKEVLPVYQQATQKAPDRKAELEKLAQQAAAAGKAGDFPAAVDFLDQLEARSKGALRASEVSAEVGKGGAGVVVFRKSQLLFRQARDRALMAVDKFTSSVLKDPATAADERFPQIEAAVNKLGQSLAALDDRLDNALDEAIQAKTDDDRLAAKGKALQFVKQYQGNVDNNALLKLIDAESGYGQFPVYKPLVKSLRRLAEMLKGS